MRRLNTHLRGLLVMLATFFLIMPASARQYVGVEVRNTVMLTWEIGGDETTVLTPPAVFTIEPVRTPSQIDFFRFAPTAPDAQMIMLNGADYAPSGALAGPFSPLPALALYDNRSVDMSAPLPLIQTERYFSGEPMVLRVIDTGQNVDPGAIDLIVIRLTSSTGDEIVLRLYESGPDTGEFFAWVQGQAEPSPRNDAVITAPRDDTLTATYVDPFDTAEVSVDVALIDPFGRVFDSVTGEMVNGARVTLIDVATGSPANVVGVDGFSAAPSTVVTGSTFTDDGNTTYKLEPGQFVFPLVHPGRYRLQIEPPAGYTAPSLATAFDGLANAPFTIDDGSYGREFQLDASGTLLVDVPLDPAGQLTVRKEAQAGDVSIGDFVPYSVTVENRDSDAARLVLLDFLPAGFRFVSGSATLDGAAIADPRIAADGTSFMFDLDTVLLPGDRVRVEYVVEVGAGAANGEAVNRAYAVNGAGEPISNFSEAAVFVREDLLRSRLTIVGRIAEAGCEADDAWARELQDGVGVQGVRLYMEDGAYAVTDSNGLYHFEDVKPGAHVVQVDTETLPAGYEPMYCEENTRYAGSATSKFVDARGGVIWRANFYLRRTGEVADEAEAEIFNDATEHLIYDIAWLDRQDAGTEWLYPSPERTPSVPSIDIGIKHAPDRKVELTLNGAKVAGMNFAGRETSADRSVVLSRWSGVDIQDGENVVEVTVSDADGNVLETMRREIWFVKEVRRAVFMPDQSELVADGRSRPTLAVRIEDAGGRPVHAGRVVSVDVEAPYRLYEVNAIEGEAAVTRSVAGNGGVAVRGDGIARIELQPTLETGRVTVRVRLDDGTEQRISAYLEPEQRDWIVVGLAEGTVGLDTISGEGGVRFGGDGEDVFTDGRVAFYAKGLVKGDWLLTMAVDTDKRRGDSDGDFRTEIDPNAYYTLYGDRSYQGYEAVSRYPLFIKLEKRQFQALFGDYVTGMNQTVLGAYQRRMSGLKTVYQGERFSVVAFLADTDQVFARDEIAADGTSGPYKLRSQPLIRQSEEVIVETRDRFRPDRVIDTRPMARYLDYDIDYRTGEVIFRAPVNATDAELNPNVIVVIYETTDGARREITAGGRAAARVAERVEIGVTGIVEGGGEAGPDAQSVLVAIDMTADIAERTQLRAEYAVTDRDTLEGHVRSDAKLIEVIHQSEAVSSTAYFREDGAGFGLGQQSGATLATRRFGAIVSAVLSESDDANGKRTTISAEADVYHEQNLSRGGSRTVTEALIRRDNQRLSLDGGMRFVDETVVGGEKRTSILAIGGARRTFSDIGLSLIARHEQPLGDDNDSSLYPQRTLIGFDKVLTRWAAMTARHEIVGGENASGEATVIGVSLKPWAGADVRVEADQVTSDAGRRLGATVGVDQFVQFTPSWSASFGVARRARIDGDEAVDPIIVGSPTGPLDSSAESELTRSEGFTSAYTGLGYRTATRVASVRVEMRDTIASERYAAIFGGAQEVSQELSFATGGRFEYEGVEDGVDRRSAEIRLGMALRPRGEGVIVLNRLDLRLEEAVGESESFKIINNLATNMMLTDATQVSGFWGVKYVRQTVNSSVYSGWTNLVGGEVRHDLSPRWDLGFSGAALVSANTGNVEYAFGPSVGFKPNENVWVSVGYNVEGFSDDDFEAAEFTRQGVYLKMRFKFDQDALRDLLDRISPTR